MSNPLASSILDAHRCQIEPKDFQFKTVDAKLFGGDMQCDGHHIGQS